MQRFRGSLIFVFSYLFAGAVVAQTSVPNAAPVDRDATPATRQLLKEIDSISGHATLSGQHNFPDMVSRYSDRVYDLIGSYPAVFGEDFGFSGGEDKDSTLGRPSMIEEAIRQYRAGSVVALTWHEVRPTDDEPVTFRDSVQGHLTDWEWKQVLTPGTDLYNRWARQVDVVAGYLRELQDAGVPVLFRPYHEMNGNWFWWGGRPGPDGSAAMYRQIYDRFVHQHQLHNLIWVWNVNSPSGNAGSVADYDPGPGYADIYTMDIYGAFEQRYYDAMVALAGPSHPIALAEVGAMPTLDVLAHQPRWAYFMMWSGMAESSNTPEQLAAMFHAPNVINRGDARLSAPLPAPTVAPLPVTDNAIPAAKSLLARLYELKGKSVMSGQQMSASSDVVAQTGPPAGPASDRAPAPDAAAVQRSPAMVEYSFSDPATKSLAADIRDSAARGQIVLLRWLPGRPTDGAPDGALTDFEWQQLIRPGTDLNTRWTAQADAVATLLKQLQQEHVAVLWSAYPGINTKTRWWCGRPGPDGSIALIRMLYERLAVHHELRNLVWTWEPAAPAFGPGGNGSLADYYPGPLYMDTLMLDAESLSAGRFRADRMLKSISGGKPMGIRIATGIPSPATVDEQTGWQWIVLPPANPANTQAAQDFYNDPRVVSISSPQPAKP